MCGNCAQWGQSKAAPKPKQADKANADVAQAYRRLSPERKRLVCEMMQGREKASRHDYLEAFRECVRRAQVEPIAALRPIPEYGSSDNKFLHEASASSLRRAAVGV